MNDRKYTLDDLESLRQKAGISYEEAVTLLDKYDGDVARALIELEKSGQINGRSIKIDVDGNTANFLRTWWRRGCSTRIVVERDGEVLVNLSVLFMILALLLGWRLVIVAALLALVLGCRVRLRTAEEPEKSAPAASQQEKAQPQAAEPAEAAEAADGADKKDDGFHSITIE